MQKRAFIAVTAAVTAALAQVAIVGPEGATYADSFTGRATVIDGDSIELGNAQIRLYAVDAFEGTQTCGRGAARWDCGKAAADKLRSLIGSRTITCEMQDIDDYGRTVGICSNGTVDLGAELVREGLALAYREFGDDYVDEEEEARAARRGAWAGEFVKPWQYRRNEQRHRAEASAAAGATAGTRAACTNPRIKGNINRDGKRIYHVPGTAAYDSTVIDTTLGERMFCTEAEARAAGWRPPRGR